VEILEGPAWERADSLADVPAEHWQSWLLGHYGFVRGKELKRDARFVIDNLRVVETGGASGWSGLGCETFAGVLAQFDLTAEQWAWLKAADELLDNGDTVEQAIVKGAEAVKRRAENPPTLLNHGQHKDDENERLSDNVSPVPSRGVSADYLTARIARDAPEVLARMKAGEFKSVRQAAITAGIVKVPTPYEVAVRVVKKLSADDWRKLKALMDDGGQ
jgi:hypothetical protein